MKREIEHKFKIGITEDSGEILTRLKKIVIENGWSILNEKEVSRTFVYYDTPSQKCYKNGEIIRRVEGFEKDAKGKFRYDFKTGSIDNRYESSIWMDHELTPEEIVKGLTLSDRYSDIIESARANTKHNKMLISKNETRVEITLDEFKLLDRHKKPLLKVGSPKGHYLMGLRDLELELKAGDISDLDELALKVESITAGRSSKQKYSQIIEILRANGIL